MLPHWIMTTGAVCHWGMGHAAMGQTGEEQFSALKDGD